MGQPLASTHLSIPRCSACHTWMRSSHWSLVSLCWSMTLDCKGRGSGTVTLQGCEVSDSCCPPSCKPWLSPRSAPISTSPWAAICLRQPRTWMTENWEQHRLGPARKRLQGTFYFKRPLVLQGAMYVTICGKNRLNRGQIIPHHEDRSHEAMRNVAALEDPPLMQSVALTSSHEAWPLPCCDQVDGPLLL